MIGNERIRQLVNNEQLISDFDENCLKHCSYKLRIGKLIKPGGAILFDFQTTKQVKLNWAQKGMKYLRDKVFPEDKSNRLNGFDVVNYRYELKPNELVVFQTREQIKMPMNLSASYSALDSIAKEGLLLINASIVEPGYEGYLSGVLLNFSSKTFMIRPDHEIVKINFYEVNDVAEKPLNEKLGDQYTEKLQEKAKNYTQTFLDVERLKNEVIGQAVYNIKKAFTIGGLIVAVLLIYSTIEPAIYNLIWHQTWVPLSSTQQDYERSLQIKEQQEAIDSLSEKLDSVMFLLKKKDDKPTDPKR